MVSQLVSHSTYLLIALIAASLILATFSVFKGNIEKVSTESTMNIIADTVKQDILRLYSSSQESGKMEIPLQPRAGEQYTVTLENGKVVVQLQNFVVEKNISINSNLNGTAYIPAFLLLTSDNNIKTITLVGS